MRLSTKGRLGWAGMVCALALLAGCAGNPQNIDPFEHSNRFFYKFNDGLDRALLKPAADVYDRSLPEPARAALGHAFDNAAYANVILNDFLQGKVRQGGADACRMLLNSTVGLAGLIDVGSQAGFSAHSNDFGITLGKWGARPGPYLVLPVLGPSSARDLPGVGVAAVTNPLFWINAPSIVTFPLAAVMLVDARSRAEIVVRFRDNAALDPYVFTRQAYLQYRQSRIDEGEMPEDQSLYEDDPGTGTGAATRPSR